MLNLEVNSLTATGIANLADHFEISKPLMAAVLLQMGFSNLSPISAPCFAPKVLATRKTRPTSGKHEVRRTKDEGKAVAE